MNLEIKNISKSYGDKKVIDKLSFQVDGGIVLITGSSGCGKSTLLNLIMNQENLDEGEIFLLGKNIETYSREELVNIISYVGDKKSIFSKYSFNQNLKLLTKDISNEELEKYKNLFSFYSVDKTISTLSFGNRRKAELILCFLKDDPIIILDEPFDGLDTKSVSALKKLLVEKKKDHLIFISSHVYKEEIEYSLKIEFPGQKIYSAETISTTLSIQNHERVKRKTLVLTEFKENSFFYVITLVLSLLIGIFYPLSISRIEISELKDPIRYAIENDPYDTFEVSAGSTDFETFSNEMENSDLFLLHFQTIEATFLISHNSKLEDDVIYSNIDCEEIIFEDGYALPIIYQDIDIYSYFYQFQFNREKMIFLISFDTFLSLLPHGVFKIFFINYYPIQGVTAYSFGDNINLQEETESVGLVPPIEINILQEKGVVSLTSFKKGEIIPVFDGEEKICELIATDNIGYNALGYDVFFYILSLSYNYMDSYKFALVKNKEQTIALSDEGFYIYTYIPDNIESIRTSGIYLLITTIFLFILLNVFVFLSSRKKIDETYKTIFFYRTLGYSNKQVKQIILMPYLIIIFLTLITSSLFYPLAIHIANLDIYNIGCYGNYSSFMREEAYSIITEPLKFQTFSFFFLFILLIFILLIYPLMNKKKTN